MLPAYREAAERGQVELSTSPFYHPILPLLCDSDVHLRAHPGAARPAPQVRSGRMMRGCRLARALSLHESVFGHRPRGYVALGRVGLGRGDRADARKRGVEWTATDEDILARSLDAALAARRVRACAAARPACTGRTESGPTAR